MKSVFLFLCYQGQVLLPMKCHLKVIKHACDKNEKDIHCLPRIYKRQPTLPISTTGTPKVRYHLEAVNGTRLFVFLLCIRRFCLR